MTLPNELKELCAQWWADRLEISDKRQEFKTALITKIDSNMGLWVDYDPKEPLLSVLEEIGIELGGMFSAKGILPQKTGMNIYDGLIEVAEGYGAPFEELARYPTDKTDSDNDL